MLELSNHTRIIIILYFLSTSLMAKPYTIKHKEVGVLSSNSVPTYSIQYQYQLS